MAIAILPREYADAVCNYCLRVPNDTSDPYEMRALVSRRFRLVLAFADHVLGETAVTVLLASEDPDLKSYLAQVEAFASQVTDADGHVWIQLDDTDTARHSQLWGAFLEEVAHAMQNRARGNVPLSANDNERYDRELEVARCMVQNADRLRLCEEDRAHYSVAMTAYAGKLNAG